jgi:hypothetical protein
LEFFLCFGFFAFFLGWVAIHCDGKTLNGEVHDAFDDMDEAV